MRYDGYDLMDEDAALGGDGHDSMGSVMEAL